MCFPTSLGYHSIRWHSPGLWTAQGSASGLNTLSYMTAPFHASLLLQIGQNPVLVSKMLRHSSVSMSLDIYGHLMPGWQREAAEVFAKAMEQGG